LFFLPIHLQSNNFSPAPAEENGQCDQKTTFLSPRQLFKRKVQKLGFFKKLCIQMFVTFFVTKYLIFEFC
jgi:hypothetical protein